MSIGSDRIPYAALVLGLAGLLPFLAGAAMAQFGVSGLPGWVGALATDNAMLIHYCVVILCFMSGVLWGFATDAEGRSASLAYTLSVIPALWAFFAVAPGHGFGLWALIIGFAGLLAFDLWFWLQALTPRWWLRLRIGLTTVVLACLALAL